jgi:hypothetical protein
MNQDLKQGRFDKLARLHTAEYERLFKILMSRNALATERQTSEQILAKVQSFVTSAELAALVDTLEAMGKIDKADYMKRCVDRLKRVVDLVERPSESGTI